MPPSKRDILATIIQALDSELFQKFVAAPADPAAAESKLQEVAGLIPDHVTPLPPLPPPGAADLTQDHANELRDVLRTLTASGPALITSARELVGAFERAKSDLSAAAETNSALAAQIEAQKEQADLAVATAAQAAAASPATENTPHIIPPPSTPKAIL